MANTALGAFKRLVGDLGDLVTHVGDSLGGQCFRTTKAVDLPFNGIPGAGVDSTGGSDDFVINAGGALFIGLEFSLNLSEAYRRIW